jgi:hypothetical protein
MARRHVLLGLLLGGATLIAPALGYTRVDIDIAPPPPRAEPIPPPRPGYVWAPGHWYWDGRRHVWRPGRWLHERQGYRWVPDVWIPKGERWHYVPGHWERY